MVRYSKENEHYFELARTLKLSVFELSGSNCISSSTIGLRYSQTGTSAF